MTDASTGGRGGNLFPWVKAKTANTEYVQIETQRIKFGSMLFFNLLLHFILSLSSGFLHVKANEPCSTCEERMLSKECVCPNQNQGMYDKKLFFSSDKFALTTIFPCPCFMPNIISDFFFIYQLWEVHLGFKEKQAFNMIYY